MPRHRGSYKQYRARMHNIRKAQLARKHMYGGASMRQIAAAKRNIRKAIAARRRMYGGALPLAALMGAHATLQQVKPLTQLANLGNQLGISKPVSDFLGRSAPGRFLKSAFNFGRSTLGYGRRHRRHYRRRRGYGRRRHHRKHRHHRVRAHVKVIGGRLRVIRGHLKRKPRRYVRYY